jgi:hypothetical protein
MRPRHLLTACIVLAIGAVALPAVAAAKLPHPATTRIVPGKSIAGVKLDMTRSQVFHKWGHTSCDNSVCTWEGKGKQGHREHALVSFVHGKAVIISIGAASKGDKLKFKRGVLSKWKTRKGIHLGSRKGKVPKAYPKAKPNNGEAVNGYDLFRGSRPNLSYTRFSTPGIGASPNLLWGISVNWDVCHYSDC